LELLIISETNTQMISRLLKAWIIGFTTYIESNYNNHDMILSEWKTVLQFQKLLVIKETNVILATLNAFATFFQEYDLENKDDIYFNMCRKEI